MRIATLLAGAIAVAVAAGSLLPGGARLLPWYAPQLTHVGVYAVFALATCWALNGAGRAVLRALLLTGGFGVLVELAQLLAPARTASAHDAALNLLGAVLGTSVFALLRRAWPPRSEQADQGTNQDMHREPGRGADPEIGRSRRLGAQLERLAADRLLPVASLLQRRGQLSPELASLAMQALRIAPRLGNAPADDAAVLAALDAAGVRCLILKGTLLA
ncbi:MAG: VanZ family protein, partial [Wenzhouxiangellaceae bacterium]